MVLFKKLAGFARREAILCISAVCAVISMFFTPPSVAYISYIDVRVLCLLFCLMAVVAGLRECRIFDLLSARVLSHGAAGGCVALFLVLAPFFASMLVTNDVALITFVPLALSLLCSSGHARALPLVVALQTVAANLGSMATPVGNPQNLFLYNYYSVSSKAFFAAVLPITGISFLLLAVPSFFALRGKFAALPETDTAPLSKRIWLFAALFVLCLLTVFRVLDYRLLTAVTLLLLLAIDRPALRQVDYALLATFVCFFIFAGNIGAIPAVRSLFTAALSGNALLSSALASQIISNVPSAVLLSVFTDRWRELLLGVDIGGLGTPIASLASLISLKFYSRCADAKTGKYLLIFTALNIAFLAVLLPLGMLISQ